MRLHKSLWKNNKGLIFSYILCITVTIIITYPLIRTVGASFNPGNSLISTSIFPDNPTLDHYRDLFDPDSGINYGQWFFNSMKISIITMLISVLSVSYTAYAFSRFRFKGRKNGLTYSYCCK